MEYVYMNSFIKKETCIIVNKNLKPFLKAYIYIYMYMNNKHSCVLVVKWLKTRVDVI